jgi:hypothetical protein
MPEFMDLCQKVTPESRKIKGFSIMKSGTLRIPVYDELCRSRRDDPAAEQEFSATSCPAVPWRGFEAGDYPE